MSPAAISRLQAALAFVDRQLVRETPAAEIIVLTVKLFGAAYHATGDPYSLRIVGITGSCTTSRDTDLLASWRRCAANKLARAGAPLPLAHGPA